MVNGEYKRELLLTKLQNKHLTSLRRTLVLHNRSEPGFCPDFTYYPD
jgi:hypothetical protein